VSILILRSSTVPDPEPGPFLFTDTFATVQNPYTGQGQGKGGASHYAAWKDARTSDGHAYASYVVQDLDDYLDSFITFDTGSADHYVEVVIWRSSPAYNAGNTHEVQLIVRAGGTPGSISMWEILSEHQSTNLQCVHWNGSLNDVTLDSFTTGGNIGATPQDLDVFRAEAVGNTITVKWNGATVATKNSSLYNTNTEAGVMFFPRNGATPANFGIHSVEVGAL
jgi:hypothetical protein